MTPADKVAGTMPGTLAELSSRTGYPVSEVMRQIGTLRTSGRRVNARMGERVVDDEGRPSFEATVYTLDASAQKGVQ